MKSERKSIIPVTAIIVTRNAAAGLENTLLSLSRFDEVLVVDSNSHDETPEIALEQNVSVIPFEWDGQYPKKRQWCLDNIKLKHNWVLFIDADEVMTPDLAAEMAKLFEGAGPRHAGYFVPGRYVYNHQIMEYGLRNNKLCLFDKTRLAFPVIDDLNAEGMGEIEGHYQPVRQKGSENATIGQLQHGLLHHAYLDLEKWRTRHEGYARWAAYMTLNDCWPDDPVPWRNLLKKAFRHLPVRAELAFLHSYILKLGFLDGLAGFSIARDRWRYYRMITKQISQRRRLAN